MLHRHFLLSLALSLLIQIPAWAALTLSIPEDQQFSQNGGRTQLYTITIVDDATTPALKAGYFTLTLSDDLAMIFETEASTEEISLSGTAVDNDKIAEYPAIEFLDNDKTVKIPVLADFSVGESVTIAKLYVEGFHSSSVTSTPLLLQVNGAGEYYESSHDLYIVSSSIVDTTKPDLPENIEVTAGEGTEVKITWSDPTDLDLRGIEILRGLNGLPPSGTPYETIAPGEEEFTDTVLELGDEVTYILRTTDGVNLSENSIEYEWTVVEPTTTDDTTTDDTTTDDTTTDDTTTDDTTTDDTTTDDETASELFSDEIPEWAEAAITVLANAGVVEGNPDGTFAAAGNLNRAEAATMLWRVLKLGDPTGADEKPFTDVALGEWYTDYISSLKGLSLVSGNPDGTYEPGESINRAEFLQMAMNVKDYLEPEKTAEDWDMNGVYVDLDLSAWYAGMVVEATGRGYIQGSTCIGGTCFNAGDSINRAEASQILYNMFGNSLK